MHKVQVWAELSDDMYEALRDEARRQGVPLETLVQQTVNCLIRELDAEEHEGPCFTPPS
jgi:hypothetical protein